MQFPYRASLLALILGTVLVAGCSARTPTAAEHAYAIESQVWSPYCPGRLLTDCTTAQARQLRFEIHERIAEGQDPEEVISWVRAEYGDEAVARPPGGRRGLVVWLVPALMFVGGASVVFFLVRRWTRRPAGPGNDDRPAPPEGGDPRVRDAVRRDL